MRRTTLCCTCRSKPKVIGSQCRECRQAYNKAQWAGHKLSPDYMQRRKEKVRQWGLANREKKRAWLRKWRLKKKYGMSLSQYDDMLAAQGGRCAVCGVKAEDALRGVLDVDHDHRTGLVRGLLCSECNTGLGKFKDDAGLLAKAIRYLKTKRNSNA